MLWWSKKDDKKPEELPGVHPRHKIAEKPAEVKPEPKPKPENAITEIKSREEWRDPSGLTKTEINELRQAEFEQIGIPFKMVLLAEAKRIRGIKAKNISQDAEDMNNRLAALGFSFRISCREMFECQITYLEYQQLRQATENAKGTVLPDHSLVEIIVLREAERLIRLKHRLKENPTAGDEAKKFQDEVRELFEHAWKNSMEHQLKTQAIRRLRRENNPAGNEPPSDEAIVAMMEKIKAERTAATAIRAK